MTTPRVGILMGSKSDLGVMREAARILERFEVAYEMKVLSTHRIPEKTAHYAASAERRGLQVLIAAAGGAAHLAGTLAAHSILPVIGVPLASSSLQGLDALLSTVQMPAGVPVATMAIGKAGARNAALFACQILGRWEPALVDKLNRHRLQMREEIENIKL
ncbi:MAG: 5-(carboxyamino)imidazole ribonucleotide mutase [Acidobacteriota bacterium]